MTSKSQPQNSRPYHTDGEHLAWYLLKHYLNSDPNAWDQVAMVLFHTGHAEEWKQAMREMTVLHLTHRLVKGGNSIVGQQGKFDAVAKNNIKNLIRQTMPVDPSQVEDIFARLNPAISSSRKKINRSTRSAIENEAKRVMPYCYLCGTDLDFTIERTHWSAFTIDHVWPQAYGGESSPDNLLPACQSCNVKKSDTPSWSMYPIQALVAGYGLNDKKLATLPKELRFAVQSREAVRCAKANQMSLKEAFVSMGRPGPPSVVNPEVTVDAFNLAFSAY